MVSVQFSSVAQSCLTLCDPMNCSMPGLPVYHQLPEFTQTHVHWVSDAIQPSHPLSSPSPSAPNPSQHQSLFQWVSSSHEVAKVLEFHQLKIFFTVNESESVSHSVCPNFYDPMDYSPPGSSAHENFQARILEWVAISSSRRSPSRDRTLASPELVGRFFTTVPPGKPLISM